MKKIINEVQQLKKIDNKIPQIRGEIKQHDSLLEKYSKNILKQYESEAILVLNQYINDLLDFSTLVFFTENFVRFWKKRNIVPC